MTARVEVLTHHWVPNFGANLQAMATGRLLAEQGLSVRFCNFRSTEMEDIYRKSVSKVQWTAHERFLASHLEQGRKITSQTEFESLVKEQPADIYLTGSDAVFRLKPGTSRADWIFPNPYWLVGVDALQLGKKPGKFSLAASAMGCGFSHLRPAENRSLCRAVEDMDAVSVRDQWTRKQLMKAGVSKEIKIIPDPVFTLAGFIRQLKQERPAKRPYIILSTGGALSDKWLESFTRICEQDGLETVGLPLPEGAVDKPVSRYLSLPLDPLAWLAELAGSRGYVGVRFHPVICSIIAGAPVVAVDRYYRTLFDAHRSKTFEVMQSFGLGDSCFGSWHVPILTPTKVMKLLHRQVPNLDRRQENIGRLDREFRTFLQSCIERQ